MRAPLTIDELSAIALIRSLRPTMSIRNACRAGMSNALTSPSRPASRKICQICTAPLSVNRARVKARIIDAVCVATIIRWRWKRSATLPPTGASRKTGNCPVNPISPRRIGDFVRRYTSHACAIDCIQVPINETNWPAKNRT